MQMHPDEFQNWKTIKETFEENGTTDNFFYKRACAIVSGQPDPMKNLQNLGHGEEDKSEKS
jgi:hypothetical protein|tara:strand:+ start:5565 stop:5747 length:183 start_codon:yes stop_codon:yes gene_type:complete